MRRALPAILLLAGCPGELPDEQPCLEVAWAVASRAEQCTGDPELADRLFDAVSNDTTCVVDQFELQPEVAYECAFVVRHVACEVAVDAGEDLGAWFAVSPICPQILEMQ